MDELEFRCVGADAVVARRAVPDSSVGWMSAEHEVSQGEESAVTLNYRERLRRVAANEPGFIDAQVGESARSGMLDDKTVAVARLAALIAIGGSDSSFGQFVDDAVSAGVSADAIVGIMVEIGPVAGGPRVVSAAPHLALALGFDVESDDR